jgi:hypothetical protein
MNKELLKLAKNLDDKAKEWNAKAEASEKNNRLHLATSQMVVANTLLIVANQVLNALKE